MTQGALRIVQPDGGVIECPLKHTDVKAEIAGFIARVRVTQTFHNPTKEKIEAVYVFPLPHQAAVDEMTMVIGERKIIGLIKRDCVPGGTKDNLYATTVVVDWRDTKPEQRIVLTDAQTSGGLLLLGAVLFIGWRRRAR